MAWEARSGLKHSMNLQCHQFLTRLNGLGSPFGIETLSGASIAASNIWLNGLGSPFGIETSWSLNSPWK